MQLLCFIAEIDLDETREAISARLGVGHILKTVASSITTYIVETRIA
jgi:hypothetical protein